MSIRTLDTKTLFEAEVELPSIVYAQMVICFAINSQSSPIRGWGIETHYNNPITIKGRRYVVTPEQLHDERNNEVIQTVRLDVVENALSNNEKPVRRSYNIPFSSLTTTIYSGPMAEAV